MQPLKQLLTRTSKQLDDAKAKSQIAFIERVNLIMKALTSELNNNFTGVSVDQMFHPFTQKTTSSQGNVAIELDIIDDKTHTRIQSSDDLGPNSIVKKIKWNNDLEFTYDDEYDCVSTFLITLDNNSTITMECFATFNDY